VAPTKHLVLDEDVHKALIQRREMTGLPIGHIGNAILRGHIAASLLESLLEQQLIEKGFITTDQYQEVLKQVDRELRDRVSPGTTPIERSPQGTFLSGSWETQTLFEDPVGSFQLLEIWARDALRQPMTQHAHDSDEYVIALAGRSFFVMNGVPFTLTKGNVAQIPANIAHSAIPMDPECHLLVLVAPAISEFSTRARN
jgi:mannose-6-phosphate isomerase-like protein (cupin superfamily)